MFFSMTRITRIGVAPLVVSIIAIATGVRLIGITQPFVDAWSWRQSDVAMIAENLFRFGHDIAYPQVNCGGVIRAEEAI